MDLSSLGIRGKVYINDNLCNITIQITLEKILKFAVKPISSCLLVTNSTVPLKAVEISRVNITTHLSYLKELLPENQLLCEED